MSRIISFSGTHGTGKSTAAYRMAVDLKYLQPKKSVHVLCDQEAFCPYPINKETTEVAQQWLFGNQIKQELTALERFDIVITDRTIIDVIAYTWVAGFHDLAQGMLAYAERHMPYYHEIYFNKIANNQHCHPDGIREATDMKFRQDVEDAMLSFHQGLLNPSVFPGRVFYV
ncbi:MULTISPECIES: AAA family ATPase [Desulfobacula]|uniref:NadR/Ttd14 AAA domain-containing protein n=2 Tax=Desulfobacula TaxID=28222 RepID=K0NQM6_DESTT|nr:MULTISPECIES: AAA family ATPase [Desulfobacula]CCK81227.1 uncharacterized protein TOL2_C30700 [Desulfobacula toluolica Tol2]SDU38772.1 AAA domain-containing protein [Desulfobacula phenolica]